MPTTEAAAPELQGPVRDIMVTGVQTVGPSTPAGQVATMMAEENLRHVVVVDSSKYVVGVVSQRDVVKHFLLSEHELGPVTATEIEALITKDEPIRIAPDVSLVKAAGALATNKIGCLPVVGSDGKLLGILSVIDLLRHLTGKESGDLDTDFQFYTPAADACAQTPAYIRRVNGDLVVPLKCLENPEVETEQAMLGYDAETGRILVKFIAETEKVDGAQHVNRDKEKIVIWASTFVKHFNLLGKATAFDVTSQNNSRCLILTPRPSA